MALKFYLITNSTTLDISDGINYSVLSIEGLGFPPKKTIIDRGPFQHGVTVLDYRADARTIQIVIEAFADNVEEQFQRRAELIDYLNFSNDPAIFRIVYDTGQTKDIECFINGGMTFPSKSEKGFDLQVGIELLCPDPSFFNPTEQNVELSYTFTLSGFSIPVKIPCFFSESILNNSITITYSGTWIEFPRIRILGPIVNPLITNQTTGEILEFLDTDIVDNDYYDIDCQYGYKTVTDSGGSNRIANLSNDSDLATFHLARKEVGENYKSNVILAQGIAISNDTDITISYFEKFIGI